MTDHTQAGIFPGTPRAQYDAIPAINFSTLKHCRQSPAHARHRQLNPEPPTASQELGTLIHAYLLEPDRFAREFIELPDLTAGLKTKNGDPAKNPTATVEYKARLADFQADNPGRTLVRPDDMAALRGIGESVTASATASHALTGHGEDTDTEVAVVWQDPGTGLWCKGLVDFLDYLPTVGYALDVKSVDDASPGPFARLANQHAWHVQAAWYLWGLSVVGKTAQQFLHVAVETSAPFGVAVYELDDVSLDQGLRTFRTYLDAWSQCVQCGRWSAYPDAVQPLSIPKYAITRDES